MHADERRDPVEDRVGRQQPRGARAEQGDLAVGVAGNRDHAPRLARADQHVAVVDQPRRRRRVHVRDQVLPRAEDRVEHLLGAAVHLEMAPRRGDRVRVVPVARLGRVGGRHQHLGARQRRQIAARPDVVRVVVGDDDPRHRPAQLLQRGRPRGGDLRGAEPGVEQRPPGGAFERVAPDVVEPAPRQRQADPVQAFAERLDHGRTVAILQGCRRRSRTCSPPPPRRGSRTPSRTARPRPRRRAGRRSPRARTRCCAPRPAPARRWRRS